MKRPFLWALINSCLIYKFSASVSPLLKYNAVHFTGEYLSGYIKARSVFKKKKEERTVESS